MFFHFLTIILNEKTHLNEKSYVKGLIFGVIGFILVGLQPIIAVSKPETIDVYLFAAMTCFVEAVLFFPLMLIDRRSLKLKCENGDLATEECNAFLNGWKTNKVVLIYVGLTFGIGQLLFMIGYQHSGAINGSLAQKSTVLFSLLFGVIIMKERISKVQVIFSLVLLFGLMIAVTQGSFNLLEFNIGVLLLIILAGIWMLAHVITKKYILDENNSTATQMVFIRNGISAIFLLSTYFLFFPLENISLIINPINMYYYILMGTCYGIGLFMWYKTLSLIDASKATVLYSPTPIVTAIFSVFLLGNMFSVYQLIGGIIVIISIIMIVKPKSKNKKEKKVE
jgi:drug/metabolite transporter (DMT)-like permease